MICPDCGGQFVQVAFAKWCDPCWQARKVGARPVGKAAEVVPTRSPSIKQIEPKPKTRDKGATKAMASSYARVKAWRQRHPETYNAIMRAYRAKRRGVAQ